MGKLEQQIAKQAIRSGAPLPDNIQNAPVLHLGMHFYFDAFYELNSDRQIGMTAADIPRRSIVDYAARYELDFDETEDFIYLIRAMDRAHLEKVHKKNE